MTPSNSRVQHGLAAHVEVEASIFSAGEHHHSEPTRSCQEIVQDTFVKFGWPLAFGSISEACSMPLGALAPSNPTCSVGVGASSNAHIPPPPVLPPRLPSAVQPVSHSIGAHSREAFANSSCVHSLQVASNARMWADDREEEEHALFHHLNVNCDVELGTPELPTIGSAGHWKRKCKPCVFFHTKGCSNGPSCEFCHLCDAGEKQRRQKQRQSRLQSRHHRFRIESSKSW